MVSLLLIAQLAVPAGSPLEIRSEDFALLPLAGAVLFNNVFNKGGITDAQQHVFRQGSVGGWVWDWPEGRGPGVKAYPEVILGRSPWNEARAGERLPCPIGDVRLALDFDFDAEGTGSWCTSFDFWITSQAAPKSEEIVGNLCIWTQRNAMEPVYKGRRDALAIDGRRYEAILQTPADAPGSRWRTLCLVDAAPRSSGSLDLGVLMKLLVERGLARPTDFLATAELGSEVAFGKGRLTLRRFSLR
jgi:hypothetical protein